jgi:hypothetical protein
MSRSQGCQVDALNASVPIKLNYAPNISPADFHCPTRLQRFSKRRTCKSPPHNGTKEAATVPELQSTSPDSGCGRKAESAAASLSASFGRGQQPDGPHG